MTRQEASERYQIPMEILEEYERWNLCGEATAAERMRILNQKRKRILDEIHIQEGQLEQLDYLRYKIQKNMR